MKKRQKRNKILSYVFLTLVYIYLYIPILVTIVYSFNANDSNITFGGFSLEPYVQAFTNGSLWENFFASLKIAIISTLITAVLGTLATVGMHRYEFKAKKVIDVLLYVPIVIPELVLGVASLIAFSKMGWKMGYLTLIISHVAFTLPYMVITLRARIADFDKSLEEAAMDLGANSLRTLQRVTIPILLPGIISGCFLSMTLSLDDVVISYFVSSASVVTFPVKVYGMVRQKVSTEVYVISTIMILGIILLYGIMKLITYMRTCKKEAKN